MLIRSQDKTAIVKFENVVINLKLPESLRVICWSLQDAQRSGGYFVLGEYSTKEKAMKVLDMIQEVYEESQLPVIISALLFTDASAVDELKKELSNEKLKNRFVFQMPTDSEVEV